MKKFLMASIVMVLFLLNLPGLRAEDPVVTSGAEALSDTADSLALDEDTDSDLLLDDAEYSYGTVNSVRDTVLTVTEYDYDTGEDISVSYDLDPKVELDGVNSIAEIAVKDNIEIDYLVKDGKKIAIALYVEKPLEEEVQPAA